jgi:ubiquinone/menaquinone biosynthesis C-methylase UbiE
MANSQASRRHFDCNSRSMFHPAVSISQRSTPFVDQSITSPERIRFAAPARRWPALLDGMRRRWRRERRRRKVGRAYDMALEIARLVPTNSRVLDVGCGNGFVAHHLSAATGSNVIGLDLEATTEAAIDYRQFDGKHFPVADESVDAALLCYVLHHAQDLDVVMDELRRVLRRGGVVVVYEDMPESSWDRLVCLTHDWKWRKRTGRCTFRSARNWRSLFNSAGFEIVHERPLSRWRNLAHLVSRRLFVLKQN